MENMTDRVCPYCGAPTVEILEVLGRRMEFPKPCNCKQARAEQAKEQALEEARAKAEREERLNKRLIEHGIPARSVAATHPQALQLAKEVDDGGWLYIVGPYGVGKTYLACAIARVLARNSRRVLFRTGVDLLIELQSTYNRSNSEDEQDLIERYSKAPFLIVDDIGKEAPTEWALTRLYAIINRRNADMKSTIFTSNYKVSELVGRMATADETTAEALASRIAGASRVIELHGDDRRMA